MPSLRQPSLDSMKRRLNDPGRIDGRPMSQDSTNADSLLAAARALVPVLAQREPAANAGRRIPDETIADFHRAGIIRALQPHRFGGCQAGFAVFSRIVETLAEGCAASAWVYAVFGEHQWIIASMPEQAQIDVWGDDPGAVASSSLAPRETARPVQSGWRLSGRFPFSSGCEHAQWAIIGARAPDEAGNQPTRYMLIPIQEIDILDDWHVLGLRGTGSRTLVLRDVFVPAHRTVLLRALMEGRTPGGAVHPEYSLLRAPRGYLVPFSLPPVAFALANRALTLVPAALRSRLSRGVHDLGASEVVQMRLGEAAAAIELATLIMHTRRDESLAALATGRAIEAVEIVRNRRDVAYATRALRRGVEMLAELSGARTVYDADPLQPILRDVMTIASHSVVQLHPAMVPSGRILLGLPQGIGET
jgi:3-hydroxy-9,10-secoandrosta-1,3,5(10)-triene-9,17-dione monooxygenase